MTYWDKKVSEDDLKSIVFKENIETQRDIVKNTLGVFLSFRGLVGKHFDRITDPNVRYKIFKGAKGTKKSETIIAWIIFQTIFKPKYNAIVIRRYMKDHGETTVAGFMTVLLRIQHKFGYEWDRFWKMSSPQANQPYIWHNRNGINGAIKHRQEIRLISFENSDFGSQKWYNGGYCGTLHWEEPLEKIDTKKKGSETITDDFIKEKWPILEESFLRYDSVLHTQETVGQQEVIFSFNSWNKYHFVVQDYVYAFMKEDEEALEKYGKQEYYSQKAHSGLGTYIMLMTWKVNEFRTINEIKMIFSLRKRSYRDYRTIYLGLDYIFAGGVLSDIWYMAKVVDDKDHELPYRIKFGGDWSSSKDKSGMVMCKVWHNEDGTLSKIRFSNCKVFDRTNGQDLYRANHLLNWTDEVLEKYTEPIMKSELGTPVALIDNRDAFWIDYMQQNKHKLEIGKHVAYIGANKHDTHKNAAGLLSRAFAFRALIISGIAEFTKEVYELLKEEAETLEWVDEGVMSDGKDDVFQMCGYAISDDITRITKSTGISI